MADTHITSPATDSALEVQSFDHIAFVEPQWFEPIATNVSTMVSVSTLNPWLWVGLCMGVTLLLWGVWRWWLMRPLQALQTYYGRTTVWGGLCRLGQDAWYWRRCQHHSFMAVSGEVSVVHQKWAAQQLRFLIPALPQYDLCQQLLYARSDQRSQAWQTLQQQSWLSTRINQGAVVLAMASPLEDAHG